MGASIDGFQMGIPAGALVNCLTLLGWAPDGQEILTCGAGPAIQSREREPEPGGV
jgi:hypothetical protein